MSDRLLFDQCVLCNASAFLGKRHESTQRWRFGGNMDSSLGTIDMQHISSFFERENERKFNRLWVKTKSSTNSQTRPGSAVSRR